MSRSYHWTVGEDVSKIEVQVLVREDTINLILPDAVLTEAEADSLARWLLGTMESAARDVARYLNTRRNQQAEAQPIEDDDGDE